MNKLPLKISVLQCLKIPANQVDILAKMQGIYGNEKQCTLTEINRHLVAFEAIGLLRFDSVKQVYHLTPEGVSRLTELHL